MIMFFNILTHLLVVLGILSILYFVGYMIYRIDSILEKIIRISALTTGLLIYIGAKAIGISFPILMIGAINTTNPFTTGFVGVIFPSLIGTIVAWYCVRNIKKSEDLAARLIILVTSFVIVLFGDVYVQTFEYNVKNNGLNLLLLPNLTFTIGLSLYVIFNYRHEKNTN